MNRLTMDRDRLFRLNGIGGTRSRSCPTMRVGLRYTEDEIDGDDVCVQMGQHRKIFLWSNKISTTSRMYAEVRGALGPHLRSALFNVKRVCNIRKGTVCWHLTVHAEVYEACMTALVNAGTRRRWYVRAGLSYEKRRQRSLGHIDIPNGGACTAARSESTDAVHSLKVVSYNIAGFMSKRAEIGQLCTEKDVDILLLQETNFLYKGYSFKLHGYNSISSDACVGKPGQRGVAVAVRMGCVALPIGSQSPYFVVVRTFVAGMSVIVGSVYIPPRNVKEDGRKQAVTLLHDEIVRLRDRFPHIPMLLGGDWNMDRKAVEALMMRWRLGLVVAGASGSEITWQRGSKQSALDYFVVSQDIAPRCSRSRVLRDWDLSDHWPLEIRVRLHGSPPDQSRPGDDARVFPVLNLEQLQQKAEAILGHNSFGILLEDMADDWVEHSQSSLGALIEGFTSTSAAVAIEAGVAKRQVMMNRRQRHGRPRRHFLSAKTVAIIGRRRQLAYLISQGLASKDAGERDRAARAQGRLHRLKKASRKAVRDDQRRGWVQFVKKGMSHLIGNRPKLFWRWAKKVAGRGRQRTVGLTPIKDSKGQLILDPQAIANTWAQHCASLCADVSGHSRDASFWQGVVRGRPRPDLQVNDDVSWPELVMILRQLKSGKAPGRSGLSMEWLKLAIESNPGTEPQSPFGKILFTIVKHVFEDGVVPDNLNKALVVNIPKKGDLTDPNNYRGISLMECVLKVVCTLAIRRVEHAVEEAGILVREQAGFRQRSECAAHVVTLWEVCRRRTLSGVPTYVAFLDLRKAYDSVPHEALFAKLEHLGVRGRMLRFIRAVYANSTFSVLLPTGLSPEVSFLRGSRQGCPMSPVLFNLFINDLFDGCRSGGVPVDGVVGRIPGLLYADDAALCATSIQETRKMLKSVGAWAKRWEMSFGISKCGVFVVNGDMMALRHANLKLNGEMVPVVEAYTYLGVDLHFSLDLDMMVAERAVKLEHAAKSLEGMLRSRQIPLAAKIIMVRHCLLPIAAYGGELWGMQQERSRKLQAIINRSLRTMLNAGKKRGHPSVLSVELGIPSVHSMAMGARARALLKFPSLPTWIRPLMAVKYPKPWGRCESWVTGGLRWLKRCGSIVRNLSLDEGAVSRTQMVRTIRSYFRTREWEVALKTSPTCVRYEACEFESTRLFIKKAAGDVSVMSGVYELVRCRIGAVWTGQALARSGFIPDTFVNKCPCCLENSAEDVAHWLWECAVWHEQRITMMEALSHLSIWPEIVAESRRRVRHPRTATFWHNWLLGGGADADFRSGWLEEVRDGISTGCNGWRPVSIFLQTTAKKRWALIWSRVSTLSRSSLLSMASPSSTVVSVGTPPTVSTTPRRVQGVT